MKKLAIGLMSGTSCDGLSIAYASFNKNSFNLLRYQTISFPKHLPHKIVNASKLTLPEISRLNVELGEFYGKSVKKFIKTNKINPKKIQVIGSHGQTIYHGPNDAPRNTFQIGEPSMIAELTGIPVVADFRMRDIAAGGEGAPLMPYFDEYFFGNGHIRALQNIGGIGNVSLVGSKSKHVAFDTGPGNCLIDWAIQKITKGSQQFDRNGQIASRGKIDIEATEKMLRHPYFKKTPPKSTGRELFNESFIPYSLLQSKPENLAATLTYFTALTIAESYKKFLPKNLKEVIVSGGGALNSTLMRHLKKLLNPVVVKTLSDYGVHVQAKEPIAFAFFALQAIQGKINHSPAGTGARRACILGKLIPGNQ